jgi:hypothetical protein
MRDSSSRFKTVRYALAWREAQARRLGVAPEAIDALRAHGLSAKDISRMTIADDVQRAISGRKPRQLKGADHNAIARGFEQRKYRGTSGTSARPI